MCSAVMSCCVQGLPQPLHERLSCRIPVECVKVALELARHLLGQCNWGVHVSCLSLACYDSSEPACATLDVVTDSDVHTMH